MNKPNFIAGKTFKLTDADKRLLAIDYFLSKNKIKYLSVDTTLNLEQASSVACFFLDSHREMRNYDGTRMVSTSIIKKIAEQHNNKKERKVGMLKKVTNFVKGLKQPQRTFVRLGWIEVDESAWVITQTGLEAVAEAMLIENSTVEEYAKKELARLEKEDKKDK